MPVELLLLIAAVIVAALVLGWMVKVVKATLSTAIMIAAIVLVLAVLGIGPNQLWQQVTQLPQIVWTVVRGGR
jgi:hypothetical protein